LSGWIRFRCLSADDFADFHVDAGNSERSAGGFTDFPLDAENSERSQLKQPKLSFKVKRFEHSYSITEADDFIRICEVVSRSALKMEDSLEDGLGRLKEDLNVRWYKWSEPDDMSYFPDEEDGHRESNCTSESMDGTKWTLMTTSKVKEGQVEPHIKMLKKEGGKKEWGFKLEDVINDDRRGYKCVVYNISQPANCSQSVFFLRVKNKYAALWPVIGIVAEVVIVCAVIYICERRCNSKDESEEMLNGNGIVVGGKQSPTQENSSVSNFEFCKKKQFLTDTISKF